MTQKMLINAEPGEVRIAILNNAVLQDFDIETETIEKVKGNIYKGIVTAVEPSLNAAFVNYGAEKQGFLTANDVRPELAPKAIPDDVKYPRITDLLRPKQEILVQVTKDEVGTKGAVLTTYLSLAGRYLVLMPNSTTNGISRKIEDEKTRARIREAAAKLAVPEGMGVIIRTAGHDRAKADLNRDLKFLMRLWENIQKQSKRAKAPALIFKEQDVIIRALRDYFSSEIDEVVLDADEAYDRAAEYMNMVMPRQKSVLSRYVERRPIFHHYRVEEQLEAIYQPRVQLPSGGSIVIEPTEALVSIDVNSGKQKSSDQEATALQTNLEAAREVARQLCLRDLGGIIVIDFIDMMSRANKAKVERALKEALKHDKARVSVDQISRNGTLELTRQRIRSAVETSVFRRCDVCKGTGHILSPRSHASAILRRISDRASRGDVRRVQVRVEPEAANFLRTDRWRALQDVEQRYRVQIDVQATKDLGPARDEIHFETDPTAVVIPLEEPNFGPAPRPDFEVDDFEDADDDEVEVEDKDQADAARLPRARSQAPKTPPQAPTRRDTAEAQGKSAPLQAAKADHDTSEPTPLPPPAQLLADLDLRGLDSHLPHYEWAVRRDRHQGRMASEPSRGRRDRDSRFEPEAGRARGRAEMPARHAKTPAPAVSAPHSAVPPPRPNEKTSLLRRLINWGNWLK